MAPSDVPTGYGLIYPAYYVQYVRSASNRGLRRVEREAFHKTNNKHLWLEYHLVHTLTYSEGTEKSPVSTSCCLYVCAYVDIHNVIFDTPHFQ
jgi:hypothetical protein